MKKYWMLLVGAVLVAGGSFAAGSAQKEPLADFEMTVAWTGAELALICSKGCAWEELRVGFGGGPGEFTLDEFGMAEPAGAP